MNSFAAFVLEFPGVEAEEEVAGEVERRRFFVADAERVAVFEEEDGAPRRE